MAVPQLEYRYGTGTFEVEGREIRRRRDGLDAGTMKFVSEAEDTFSPGDDLSAYGYSGLQIEEVSSAKAGVIDWEHSLMVIGIASARSARREIGYPKIKKPITGWDELTDSIITTSPGSYDRGVVHATYSNMICVDSPRENIYGSYWRVSPQYQGIIGSQPTKRVITVNEEIVNPSQPIHVSYTGGWSGFHKAQVSLPKIVVMDTSIIIGDSPTAGIPGPSTPPSPPSISGITVSGADLTYRWPNGWKLASINRDEIPGTSIALQTLTYEYVWPKSF